MPLGRRLDVDADAAAVAATRVWSYGGNSRAKVFKGIPLDRLAPARRLITHRYRISQAAQAITVTADRNNGSGEVRIQLDSG